MASAHYPWENTVYKENLISWEYVVREGGVFNSLLMQLEILLWYYTAIQQMNEVVTSERMVGMGWLPKPYHISELFFPLLRKTHHLYAYIFNPCMVL